MTDWLLMEEKIVLLLLISTFSFRCWVMNKFFWSLLIQETIYIHIHVYMCVCIIIFLYIFGYVSVFFGADESATGGVKIKSILFQDSVWVSGLMVSVIFF